ncbi:carboxylating nicotinate-nucleotide diphosphorylase [Ethanoligenens harbinense]|uniref:Probable nicotinate-nucleotide pyrophosphorylase [carboxylating] n=1 Tax=Ethanoligenens harbinense (strain DSM 18485 / JCM 12961 / CGMCC 1.5033 / YUAN-3) TaxID=663278 RepID=E6U5G4_ETHHY|nr:carboxylating nicotinate-nucleotide diphosphorylase [Ethanoligenens harbinense]ADU25631.1 nicotinate-nucleotide pyrophosphorylase [Ethanoligenens harbinense YUAN-3]AVQ94807.1 nicotinate-nucleotide diphosphorylase (carboxylating) [Ethanoligenens harbinense YUAN-3]AYF37497.1 nicotinate-nucleotide diphosphorylase (carboxylating) [Ethanoligenens harbinense]AYF40217.1 nicotinate-nucleotide diphosphorylase (carboxylating) [Ethanoligenens harbinense]QCN91053.1 carboxylating nicotinate-nucleotide d
MILPMHYDEVILRGLKEDINYIDVTTDNLIPEEQQSGAVFLAKEDGVLCGLDVALRTLRLLDAGVTAEVLRKDGDMLQKGEIIARVHGNTRALLKGERTALNLLQHLSGIATATARAVQTVEGTCASVCDTRKTLPGLRVLEKYAVTVGGGKNHRFNLSDAALIKDNHVDAAGGIGKAVATLRARVGHTVKIEVETRDLKELADALAAGADIIMLDNMSLEDMREAVRVTAGRVPLEASGGVTQETLRGIAETGVNLISIGALTHSVKALDISMKLRD